jgi:hypothetical protein
MPRFDEDEKYKYDTFLRRIEHEHQLVNNRLGGFMTAQSFLFAAFVLGHNNARIEIGWFWMGLVRRCRQNAHRLLTG